MRSTLLLVTLPIVLDRHDIYMPRLPLVHHEHRLAQQSSKPRLHSSFYRHTIR